MDNIKEFNTGNRENKSYVIIISVLIVLLLGLTYLYISQKQETKRTIAELNDATDEKVELTLEYEDLLSDYESLETTNDSVASQLAGEKERVAELIAQLKSTKAQNRAQINKYKKELKTLRNIMKGFIHQIDSLNTLNIELTAENQEIKKQFYSERKKNKQLADKYADATDKVKKASVIKAVDISLVPFNHKGKITKKAKKVKRFGVNFSLDENVIAPRGPKQIYIRITDPDDHILIKNNQPVFSYEGEEIAYSDVREVEYNGELTPTTVYFEHTEDTPLPKGEYRVDIFCDGSMIGSSTVTLN